MTTELGGSGYSRFEAAKKARGIAKVVLVGSGKGGVGKSLVACGLALKLADIGYRVGILDVDLHGASIPGYLGVKPPVDSSKAGLVPKEVGGLKVMSVSLFTGGNPLPIRGSSKEGLIADMFGLTDWGGLDYLVVDLPPSTGDEVLAAFALFARNGRLLLVTTPSPGVLEVVSRLRRLAAAEKIQVLGVVVNMAYARHGGSTSFPFGRPNREGIERLLNAEVLAEIPLQEEVSGEGLQKAMRIDPGLSAAFEKIAKGVSTSGRPSVAGDAR